MTRRRLEQELASLRERLAEAEETRGGTGHPSKGLGLGLYITQQIVRSHGGTLTVESSQDGGTKFSVVLPRIPGSRPRIA